MPVPPAWRPMRPWLVVVFGLSSCCRVALTVEVQAALLEVARTSSQQPLRRWPVARGLRLADLARLEPISSSSRLRRRVSRLCSTAWRERDLVVGQRLGVGVQRPGDAASVGSSASTNAARSKPRHRAARCRRVQSSRAGVVTNSSSAGCVRSGAQVGRTRTSRSSVNSAGSSSRGHGLRVERVRAGQDASRSILRPTWRVARPGRRSAPPLGPAELFEQDPLVHAGAAGEQLQVAVARGGFATRRSVGMTASTSLLAALKRARVVAPREVVDQVLDDRLRLLGRLAPAAGSSRITSSGSLPAGRRTTPTSVRRPLCALRSISPTSADSSVAPKVAAPWPAASTS